ncbi:TPA: NADH dehydrogenase subunit 5 [Trebouxia sp. C0006]
MPTNYNTFCQWVVVHHSRASNCDLRYILCMLLLPALASLAWACHRIYSNFWFTRLQASKASIKAMLVNRVGDFGLSLGIMAIFSVFKSVDFATVFSCAPHFADTLFVFCNMECTLLNVVCILLFIGAVGKSAQLGLHTWLPDAMEGPTPVSALIHAATMVTAGVFLIARCSPLFEYAPNALMIVTLVGGMTCFFAATTGIVQNDLKRVIAYSTCSQLGYMVFACGISNYSVGVFHLMSHAFFKALLFLSAGSVIHALSDEQDMRKMGVTAVGSLLPACSYQPSIVMAASHTMTSCSAALRLLSATRCSSKERCRCCLRCWLEHKQCCGQIYWGQGPGAGLVPSFPRLAELRRR